MGNEQNKNNGTLPNSAPEVEKFGVRQVAFPAVGEPIQNEAGYDVFVNGVQAFRDGGRRLLDADPQIPTGFDAWHIRVVLRETGLAMEWVFPKSLYPVVLELFERTNGLSVRDNGDEIVVIFRDEAHEYKFAFFRRGTDGLFRLEDVTDTIDGQRQAEETECRRHGDC